VLHLLQHPGERGVLGVPDAACAPAFLLPRLVRDELRLIKELL
jgi:hypothetical protein